MDDIQKAAYVIAQAACAQIEAMGMMAENQRIVAAGRKPIYEFCHFIALADKYCIHHNAVISTFHPDF